MPSTSAIGRKTTTVVAVAMTIASEISPAPLTQASRRGMPVPWRRKMFSATTTELSTRRPIEIIRPSRVRMLSVSPKKYIATTPISMESGIDSVMISVIRKRRRKKKSTRAAKTPPILPLSSMMPSDSRIVSPWLKKTSMPIGSRRGFSCSFSTVAATSRETSMGLASPSLVTTSIMAGRDMARTRKRRSGRS